MQVILIVIVVFLFLLILGSYLYTGLTRKNTSDSGELDDIEPEPSEDIENAASMIQRFADHIPLGISATTNAIRLNSNIISSIKVWFATPMNGNSNITLILYRYRRINDVFSYTALNDPIMIDSSLEWSTWYDFTSSILPIDIDQKTDTISISTVYNLGTGTNTIRGLTVSCTTDTNTSINVSTGTISDGPVWP